MGTHGRADKKSEAIGPKCTNQQRHEVARFPGFGTCLRRTTERTRLSSAGGKPLQSGVYSRKISADGWQASQANASKDGPNALGRART